MLLPPSFGCATCHSACILRHFMIYGFQQNKDKVESSEMTEALCIFSCLQLSRNSCTLFFLPYEIIRYRSNCTSDPVDSFQCYPRKLFRNKHESLFYILPYESCVIVRGQVFSTAVVTHVLNFSKDLEISCDVTPQHVK